MGEFRILAIDSDTPTLLRETADSGVHVTEAGLEEGIRLAGEGTYGLYVADISDGLAAISSFVRKVNSLGDRSVLVLTGSGTSNERRAAMMSGAHAYLPKPVDSRELYGLVMKARDIRTLAARSERLERECRVP